MTSPIKPELVKAILQERLKNLEIEVAGAPQANGLKDALIKSNIPGEHDVNRGKIMQNVVLATDMAAFKRGKIVANPTGYNAVAKGYHYDVDASQTPDSLKRQYQSVVKDILSSPEKLQAFTQDVILQHTLNDPKVPRQKASIEPSAPTFALDSDLSAGAQRA